MACVSKAACISGFLQAEGAEVRGSRLREPLRYPYAYIVDGNEAAEVSSRHVLATSHHQELVTEVTGHSTALVYVSLDNSD